MTNNEVEFSKTTNIDKAKNKIKFCIGLTIISLVSYVKPLIVGDFDFGIVFEIVSLIFVLIARKYIPYLTKFIDHQI